MLTGSACMSRIGTIDNISFKYLIYSCSECIKIHLSIIGRNNWCKNFLLGGIVIPLSLDWQPPELINVRVDRPFLAVIKYYDHAGDKSGLLNPLTSTNLLSSKDFYGYVPMFTMKIHL